MRITGKYNHRVVNENGEVEISFKIDNIYNQEEVKELKKDIVYQLEIKEVGSKRSVISNNLMWKLIHELSIALNSEFATSDDDWNIYLQLLEMAGVKSEFVAVLPECEPMLKKQFRAIRFLNKFMVGNVEYSQYRCYLGSSKMNTKEMSLLIEHLKDWCAETGVKVDYEF